MSGAKVGGASNTPLKTETPQCSIDHMTLVSWLPLDDALAALSELLEDDFTGYVRGFNGYAQHVEFHKLPVKVAFTEGREDVCVILPGSACSALGLETLLTIASALAARPSRIDIAIDGAPFSPKRLYNHICGNERATVVHANTRAQAIEYIESHDGATCNIGSRESPRFARCYDMHGFTRFEIEYKQAAARAVLASLYKVGLDGFAAHAFELLNDFIRVTDQRDEHLERRHRATADFWAAFVGMGRRAKLKYSEVITSTYETFMSWAERCLPAVIRCYQRAAEYDKTRRTLIGLAQLGDERQQPKHKQMIFQARIAGARFAPRGSRFVT
jgi:DNA relaxase NicK